MEGIKELVFTLCMVSLAAGVFRILAPSGGLQRTAAMVMGLFTLVCFLMPFTQNFDLNSLFSFSLEELEPSSDLLQENREVFEQAAVDEVTQTVLALAEEQGIGVQVSRVVLQEENGELLVEKVEMVVEGTETQAKKLKERVLQVVKCEVLAAWTKES